MIDVNRRRENFGRIRGDARPRGVALYTGASCTVRKKIDTAKHAIIQIAPAAHCRRAGCPRGCQSGGDGGPPMAARRIAVAADFNSFSKCVSPDWFRDADRSGDSGWLL